MCWGCLSTLGTMWSGKGTFLHTETDRVSDRVSSWSRSPAEMSVLLWGRVRGDVLGKGTSIGGRDVN